VVPGIKNVISVVKLATSRGRVLTPLVPLVAPVVETIVEHSPVDLRRLATLAVVLDTSRATAKRIPSVILVDNLVTSAVIALNHLRGHATPVEEKVTSLVTVSNKLAESRSHVSLLS